MFFFFFISSSSSASFLFFTCNKPVSETLPGDKWCYISFVISTLDRNSRLMLICCSTAISNQVKRTSLSSHWQHCFFECHFRQRRRRHLYKNVFPTPSPVVPPRPFVVFIRLFIFIFFPILSPPLFSISKPTNNPSKNNKDINNDICESVVHVSMSIYII